MTCSSYKLDQWLKPYVPLYAFQFDDHTVPMYMPPVSFPYGSAHTSEMQFLFPNFHGGRGEVRQLSAQEQQLSAQMLGYWTAFATKGDPNGAARPVWPKYNDTAQFLSLRPGGPVAFPGADYATQHHCGFWDTIAQY